jgi:Zn-dependent protease
MNTIFQILVLIFSTVIHEIAHGAVAYSLGDSTAKNSGRLTLNPLKHIDPFGSIALPFILYISTAGRGPIFGWAKPVPVNPYNFCDQKWGQSKVSFAGPAANLVIALVFSLFLRFLSLSETIAGFFSIIAVYNFVWTFFNLVPIPPLDGSWILFAFLPKRFWKLRSTLETYGSLFILTFIFLGVDWIFNLAFLFFRFFSGI